ncbi:MAG TPA: biotin/lipoyl-binding protein, partial [Planctomycetaceae bacterium]|nr:biotin/lipoyl-binding protein [Planctomycetaceae bacterium]
MISKLAASPRPQTEEQTTTPPAENSQNVSSHPGTPLPSSTLPTKAPSPPQHSSRGWIWWVVIGILAAAVYFGWPRIAPVASPWLETHAKPLMDRLPWLSKGEEKNAKPTKRSVPVVAATVRRGDLDIYLNGLGTVTAFKTVTVRSRVEGELINVAFEEGQMVNEGDLLAEIDPRQFQAALEQAEGALDRDEAMLKGANLTLERFKKLVSTNTVTAQQVDEQTAL